MISVKQKIEKLEREVKLLRKELNDMRRIVRGEVFPIIIERISPEELNKAERKALERVMKDFREKRMENFVKLEEL